MKDVAAEFIISKEFHFSASHQLTHLEEKQPDHPCARLHGHNYLVRFFIAGPLDENGFVWDYNNLKGFQKGEIDDKLDHRHLNDVLGNSYLTTAESLAEYLFYRLEEYLKGHNADFKVRVQAVEVCETPKTCARFQLC